MIKGSKMFILSMTSSRFNLSLFLQHRDDVFKCLRSYQQKTATKVLINSLANLLIDLLETLAVISDSFSSVSYRDLLPNYKSGGGSLKSNYFECDFRQKVRPKTIEAKK
jgi:hypothetical protein